MCRRCSEPTVLTGNRSEGGAAGGCGQLWNENPPPEFYEALLKEDLERERTGTLFSCEAHPPELDEEYLDIYAFYNKQCGGGLFRNEQKCDKVLHNERQKE